MSEPDYMTAWHDGTNDGRPRDVWVNNGFAADEEHPAVDPSVAFTSLAFIGEALKRNVRIWCIFAVAGLLIGAGLFVKFPAPFQATTLILLKENPNIDPSVAIQTDATLAQSTPVAERVIRQLGLRQNVSGLLALYTIQAISNNVIKLTVNGSSGGAAVHLASALAANYLQYRTNYYQAQLQQVAAELDQQFNRAQRRLNSLDTQIGQVQAQPNSPDQQAELNNLQVQRSSQIQIEQYVNNAKATNSTITYQMLKYSQVINDAAPLPHTGKRHALEEIGGGLLAGLAVGAAFIIIQALVSERLRRRDDVADALGAPIRISVRSPRRRRWLPGRRKFADLDIRRVVAHLNSAVPEGHRGLASLAVVAVDNADVAASAVVSLAVSCAREGRQVAVADLSGGAVAGLLGVADPGVHIVQADGERLTVAIPERDDAWPVGPLQYQPQNSWKSEVSHAQANQAFLAACASSDLLLTLAILDPASGGDYLVTWATAAVAVVTAGLSSATRIRAVGDMLRLAGVHLNSAVLIGADKSDESLGVVIEPSQSMQV